MPVDMLNKISAFPVKLERLAAHPERALGQLGKDNQYGDRVLNPRPHWKCLRTFLLLQKQTPKSSYGLLY